MGREPLISFIVPAYNAEKTICQCVKSILNITEAPIEVIVVDDGSADGTWDVCRGISDERLQIVQQENQGVSTARNRGIQEAQGKYISFCDADDLIVASEMEKVIADMDVEDELVMYNVCRGTRGKYKTDLPVLNDGEYGKEALEFLKKRCLDVPLYQNWESHIIQGSVCRYLFQREKLDEYHIRFMEKLPYAEDLCFMMEVFKKFSCIRVKNHNVYRVHIAMGTASRKYRPHIWRECKQRYEVIEALLGKPDDVLYCHDGRGCITHYVLWAKFLEGKRKIKEIMSDTRLIDILSGIQFDDKTRGEKVFDWCVLRKHPIMLWLYFLPGRIRFRWGRLAMHLIGKRG